MPIHQNSAQKETRWIQLGFWDKRGSCEDEIPFCCRRKGH